MGRIKLMVNNHSWKVPATFALLLGLVALSPAPIKDPRSAQHELPQHSAAQRAAEMKFNGTMGVVGSVPEKTNQDGTGPDPVTGDSKAGSIIAVRPIVSDPAAIKALTKANEQLQQKAQDQGVPWLTGLLVFLGGFGAFQGIRFWLAKSGPAPRRAALRDV